MGISPLQDSRSYSTSDLCDKMPHSVMTKSEELVSKVNCSISSRTEKENELKKSPSGSSASHPDERVLKRSAPGETSGYYRFYHSLPHHYKLPILNPQGLVHHQAHQGAAKSGNSQHDYSQKLALMVAWFKGFNSDQKNKLLTSLINECEQPQNHLLSMLLQDSLHKSCPPNCQDFLLWLPLVLAYKILSYLDPVSLAKCSQVCKYWHTLSNAQFLWQRLSLLPHWKLTQAGHLRQISLIAERDKKISWKKVCRKLIPTCVYFLKLVLRHG